MLGLSVPAMAETFDSYESQVFETTGTHQDITRRAQLCVAQIVRNDQFNHIESGPVILANDPEAGQVIANSRLDMRSMGLTNSLQSTLSVLARDGRFKITHTKILFAVENYGRYDPIHIKSPYAAKARKALDSLDTSLNSCIQKTDSW